MKKISKLILLCTLFAVLFVGLSVNSLAAAPFDINVQVGDKLIEFKNVKPIEQNGRTFVPLRAFFEGLGAEVSYYESSQTIEATRGDTSVIFTIGYTGMQTVSPAGTDNVTMDAAPFFQNGYAMVPVRYAAQAFGCTVGWDDDAQTVLILDIDGLIKNSGAHFTLMDKLMNSSKDDKTYAVNGSCDISILEDALENEPVNITGTFTGIQNRETSNLDMSLDFSSLIDSLGEELSDEDKLLLENFKIKAILNNSTGKMYMQSEILSKLLGTTGDIWFMMDFSEFMPDGFDILNIVSFEDYLKSVLTTSYLYSNGDLEENVNSIKQIIALCGDESFTKSGNKYTNVKTIEADGNLNIKFEFDVVNDKAVSYNMAIEQKSDDSNLNMSVSMSESKNISLVLSVDSLGSKIEMTMDMKLTETSKTPDAQPKAGSAILDIMNMLGTKLV